MCTTDPFIGWGRRRPLLMYVVVAAAVFVPAMVLSLRARTFLPDGLNGCQVPFVTDYAFHVVALVAVPLTTVLLNRFFAKANEIVEELSARGILGGGLLLEEEKFQASCRPWLYGLAIGGTLALVIAFVNLKTLGVYSWWYAGGRFGAGTLFMLLAGMAEASVISDALIRYFRILRVLSRQVEALKRAPTWLADPAGPVWPFFRDFYIALLPAALLPLSVWASRTLKGRISLWDPISILNIVALPAGTLLILIVPVIISGIPRRLRQQRDALLHEQSSRIDEALAKFLTTSNRDKAMELVDEIREIAKTRAIIEKESMVWPFPEKLSRTLLFNAVPALLSIIGWLAPRLIDILQTHFSQPLG